MSKILAFFMSIFAFFSSFGSYNFEIDASQMGNIVGNKASNVNVWEMGTQFYDAKNAESDDIYEFVEYVQLMNCSGGSAQRDLFKDPYDNTVLDDYDFTRLIKNCNGILALGSKPCLILGNVPMKYSKDFAIGDFEVNILPPDDYDVYYNYIAALAQALVDEFGKTELLTWHYTIYTEYENEAWFKCDTPEETATEFCKIYDYTAQALIDTIGEDVYLGAHSMTVTEGYWDEAIFIEHCAKGTNYKTGKVGSKINCLSASYYEPEAGTHPRDRKNLKETIAVLRDTAEKYGLNNLDYGIDEGHVLSGSEGANDSQLLSRTVGFQWEAAYDASIYAAMINNDIDYFSEWNYKSEGLNIGCPTVTYHVSRLISTWKNSKILTTIKKLGGLILNAEVNTVSAFDKETETLHVMTYNFKNSLEYKKNAKVNIKINNVPFEDGTVKLTVYTIDENCNYFDDWLEDRKTYGITKDAFNWSPDCPLIYENLIDENVRKLYKDELKAKYNEKSKLVPTVTTAEVKDGTISIETTVGPQNVIFYDITK